MIPRDAPAASLAFAWRRFGIKRQPSARPLSSVRMRVFERRVMVDRIWYAALSAKTFSESGRSSSIGLLIRGSFWAQ